jgi:integrase
MREVDLLPALRDELTAHKAAAGRVHATDPVFPSAAGSHPDKDNIARRVMTPVVELASALLAERNEQPLPLGVTAHKLRHTFATILTALGRDPAYVMAQLGHTDPKFTLRVYAHAMRRDEGEREALRALVEGSLVIKAAAARTGRVCGVPAQAT